MRLRPYQDQLKAKVYAAWEDGHSNVLAVSPTGAGKTVVFSKIVQEQEYPSCLIAHRQELVSQMSVAAAKNKICHRIIGPKNVVKLCVNEQLRETGTNKYYDPNAPCAVAGVKTLINKSVELKHWLKTVKLWVQDEAHHVLVENTWGKAARMFPNAKGLGVTATPIRTDRKGLGRNTDGVFDTLVESVDMRDLINMGYLTDYRIFQPDSDIDYSTVPLTPSGDLSPSKLKIAVRKSNTIVGDVVEHYLRIAPGKRGLTFASDVETATDIAHAFNNADVPAAVVSANTPDAQRVIYRHKLKNKELLQLVNVDLYGEGVDLPQIETLSMVRRTESLGLCRQQAGRVLRLNICDEIAKNWDRYTDNERKAHIAASSKPVATIIDHVSNTAWDRHGVPDRKQIWSFNRRDKRCKSKVNDKIPSRVCIKCKCQYERTIKACPGCGYIPEITARDGPEQVDGDLIELNEATLARMRGEVERVDRDKEEYRTELIAKFTPTVGVHTGVKRHVERQELQGALRASINWWKHYQRIMGRDKSESYKRFYWAFGIDELSAQALKHKDALELADRINIKLGELSN